MGRNKESSAFIDGLLRFVIGGGMLTTAVIAPNALKIFDKPVMNYLNKLDNNARLREYRRMLYNMKKRGLIKYETGDYEHGIAVTNKGRKRAQKADYDNIVINNPKIWDGKWRIVLFDIPETKKTQRNELSHKLRILGFRQLQRSVWVYPFPCKAEIEAVTTKLLVAFYVTYIETSHIDHAEKLKERFNFKLKTKNNI